MLLAMLVSVCWGVSGQDLKENYVQTTAMVRKDVVPDQIFVQVTLGELAKTDNVEPEERMFKELRKVGFDTDNDIMIGDMALGARMKYFGKASEIVTTYKLRVTGMEMLGKVFRALQEAKVAKAKIVRLWHSDMQGLEEQMRTESMEAARRNAETLAKAAGREVGALVSISDYSAPYVNWYDDQQMYMAGGYPDYTADSGAEDNSLSFRNIRLEYTVSATSELK